MPKHTTTTFFSLPSNTLSQMLFALFCVVSSFAVGVGTAGEVHPVQSSIAAEQVAYLPGDVDGDFTLTLEDAIRIAEFAQGDEKASRDELDRADVDGDSAVTVRDVIRVLRTIPVR